MEATNSKSALSRSSSLADGSSSLSVGLSLYLLGLEIKDTLLVLLLRKSAEVDAPDALALSMLVRPSSSSPSMTSLKTFKRLWLKVGRGRGTGTQGRGTRGRGTRGRAGTWERDKKTTPEFVKYNFRWSRERCNMLEIRRACRVTLHWRRSSKVRVHGNFGQRGNYETCEFYENPWKDDI